MTPSSQSLAVKVNSTLSTKPQAPAVVPGTVIELPANTWQQMINTLLR